MYHKVSVFCILLLCAFLFPGFVSGTEYEKRIGASSELDTSSLEEIAQWEISGPDELCLYYGSVIADFFGGGDLTDVFRWKVFKADGALIVDREGGFQTFSHTFSEIGTYRVELEVRSGLEPVFKGQKTIKINPGVDLVIQDSYLLCDGGQATLSLVDSDSPQKDKLKIAWLDPSGNVVSNSNSLTVSKEGRYTVNFSLLDDSGNETCPFSISTFVYLPRDFKVSINNQNVCEGLAQVRLSAGSGIFGKWFAQLEGSMEKRLIGEGSKVEFLSNSLGGHGRYQIVFEVDNSEKRFCKLSESVALNVFETGDVAIRLEKPADSCDAKNGELVLEALTDLTLLRLRRDNTEIARFENVKKGDKFKVSGLSAGLYRASASLGSCGRTRVLVVPLTNPPSEMQFQVTEVVDETCTESGKVDGTIKIRMAQPGYKGSFRLLGSNGSVIRSGQLDNVQDFEIKAPAGTYFLELANPVGCVFPSPNRIVIRTKGQVNFSTPDRFTVCSYFDFVPSTPESLFFRLTYPDNQVVTKQKGEAFRLDQEGEYRILGVDVNTTDGLCPRELSFFVKLTNPIDYEPELVSTDCFGNKQYRVNLFGADPSKVNIRWINEKGVVVGNEQFLFPTSSGEFKLDVQPKDSEVCPVPPKSFVIEKSILQVPADLKSGVLCPGSQATITLTTDFEIVKKIVWLYIDENGKVESLENYLDLQQITVSKNGSYEAVLFNELGCEVGRKILPVLESKDLATFEIPDSLLICDYFDIIPSSNLPIKIEVIDPSGAVFQVKPGDQFKILKPGIYTWTAVSSDPNLFLCPVTKEMKVSRFEPFPFEPTVLEQNCDGKITYGAKLFGKDPSTLDFYWYDENNQIVGREPTLVPNSFGMFSLEVRPLGALPCPLPNKKEFEVYEPITTLEVALDASPLCPNGDFVTISLSTENKHVGSIKWFFVEFSGRRSELTSSENQFVIETSKEGTYEAEVFNKLGCSVGSDLVLVMRSTDDVRPEVEPVYSICVKFGETTEINPGEFESYQWILEGRVLSEEAVFSPQAIGNYTVRVTSSEGCTYDQTFRVIEECEMKVTHTTGMRLGDSARTFRVYQNPLVDEIKVWIYNSWGQLVFFGASESSRDREIEWNGMLNGTFVQPGSYAVKISYKNNFENNEKIISTSLTVLD